MSKPHPYDKQTCIELLRRLAAENGGWLTRAYYEKSKADQRPSVQWLQKALNVKGQKWETICAAAGIAGSHHLVMQLDEAGECTDADALAALAQHHKALFLYSQAQREALAVWCVRYVHAALGKPEKMYGDVYTSYTREHKQPHLLPALLVREIIGWNEVCERINVKIGKLGGKWQADRLEELSQTKPLERAPELTAVGGFTIKQGSVIEERKIYNWETRCFETVTVRRGWFGA
jgi:hypothetical protein